MGAVFAFVAWMIAIAVIYALSQSEAQSGALTGVVRVAGLRSIQWAARSALNEAGVQVREPAKGTRPLEPLRTGGGVSPLEPAATRALYEKEVARGELTIGRVACETVGPPKKSDSEETWLIDMTVRVDYRLGGVKLTRQLRRRHTGRAHFITMTMGPRAGQIIGGALTLDEGFLFEVMEP